MTSNATPTALQQFFQFLIRWNGTDLPKHPILNFLGGSVAEDLPNNQILITLGGGGGASFANLTANFSQPAVGAQQVAQVSLSSSYQVGATVFILGGGFYSVFAVPDSTHLTLTNTGAKSNVPPATLVTSGPLVIPSGPAPMLVQSNGAPVTLRTYLDLVGMTYADDAANDRMIFTVAPTGLGAPVTATAGAHTMQPGERWGIINPDEDWTMPAAPVVGIELVFTQQGTGYGAGHPTRFHGNGSNMQHPSVPGTQAAIVQAQTDGVLSYRFCFDGSLWRCLN